MKQSPADLVIKRFGGVRATAKAVGRSPSSVCKWRSHVTKEGIKGAIPNAMQSKILEAAKKLKIKIVAADLIGGLVVRK